MDIEFVDELPRTNAGRIGRADFWLALTESPGKWALWPGSHKSAPYQLAQAHSRNGLTFEGARRGGKNYFRCVA